MSIRRFSTASISAGTNKSTKLWDQETLPGDYEAIATAVVDSSNAANITFSNIPQNYKHLQLRGVAKNVTTGAADYDSLRMTVNSDTGTNYSTHYLQTQAAGSVGASAASSTTNYYLGGICRSGTGQTSAFSVFVVDILDYQNTAKYKTFRGLSGTEYNGTYAFLLFTSGLWQSTSAITSIRLVVDTAVNIAQYSSFALYGIRG